MTDECTGKKKQACEWIVFLTFNMALRASYTVMFLVVSYFQHQFVNYQKLQYLNKYQHLWRIRTLKQIN